MGPIYAEVTIRGRTGQKRVKMFVDTGSTFTIISPDLAEEIGAIKLDGKQEVELADMTQKQYAAAAANIELSGRKSWVTVLIGTVSEPILGALSLESLGLAVDLVSGEVYPSRTWQARGPFQARPKA